MHFAEMYLPDWVCHQALFKCEQKWIKFHVVCGIWKRCVFNCIMNRKCKNMSFIKTGRLRCDRASDTFPLTPILIAQLLLDSKGWQNEQRKGMAPIGSQHHWWRWWWQILTWSSFWRPSVGAGRLRRCHVCPIRAARKTVVLYWRAH